MKTVNGQVILAVKVTGTFEVPVTFLRRNLAAYQTVVPAVHGTLEGRHP